LCDRIILASNHFSNCGRFSGWGIDWLCGLSRGKVDFGIQTEAAILISLKDYLVFNFSLVVGILGINAENSAFMPMLKIVEY
jgi:hypothetical protein